MKKLYIHAVACVAAMVCAPMVMAQTTTTMNFNNAQVNDAGNNCLYQNVTGLTITGGNTITLSGATKCGGPVQNLLPVTVTFPASPYTSGNPTVSWSSSDSSAAVTCNVTQGGPPLTVTGSTATSVTYSAPTAYGNYTFNVSCTAPSPYTGVSYLPPGASATMAYPDPGTPSGSCDPLRDASETIGSVNLKRLCTSAAGTVSYAQWKTAYPSGQPLVNWTDVAGGNKSMFMGLLSGPPIIFQLPAGYYLSFAFTVPATASGSFQLYSNTTYGLDAMISLSTSPGKLLPGSPTVICSQLSGSGTNNVFMSTSSGTLCGLTPGKTYYLNFAGVDYTGTTLCFNGQPGSCSVTNIAYTQIASRVTQ